RLSQLGARNPNLILLAYDSHGRLSRLPDSFDDVRIDLSYKLCRVEQIERLFPDQSRETLVSYAYDAHGDLAAVRDAAGHLQRPLAYDSGPRMVEHQRPTGLRCDYQLAWVDGPDWRVDPHGTNEAGD
ncbi:hypothetical protein, partial [Pseudomonas paraveronii]|uniref:hypothetical protein n=1 Tax=Pseudomonas paraveronii TaxID=3040598 RepID=UPI002AB0BD1B